MLGDGASFAASSGARPSSAKGQKVTVKVDGTTITADVSANGTFVLKGIASGTFTLVFLVDGVEIGRVVVTAEDGAEVKIVVQVKDSVLVVVDIKVERPHRRAGPSPSTCVVDGGKVGQGIELEGDVSSGSYASFKMAVNGVRASALVDGERLVGSLPVHRRGQGGDGRGVQARRHCRREGPRARHADVVHARRARHRGRGQGPEGLVRPGRVVLLALAVSVAAALAGAAPRRTASAKGRAGSACPICSAATPTRMPERRASTAGVSPGSFPFARLA